MEQDAWDEQCDGDTELDTDLRTVCWEVKVGRGRACADLEAASVSRS